MKFQESHDFDQDAATVLAMFCDRDYYDRKYEKLGGSSEILDCDDAGDPFSITVRHALDASKMKLPDFLRKRIGDCLYLHQTERWYKNSHRGRIDIDIEKTPATIAIDMALTNTGNGARITLDFDIRVAIPLVGGKAEKAIAGPITRHVHRDMQISNDMADEYAA